MITYSLIGNEQNSGSFYLMLNIFTDIVLDEAHIKTGNIIKDFTDWVSKNEIEKVRTTDEYIVEFLTLGVLWNNYSSKAIQTGTLPKKIVFNLYKLRRKYPKFKKYIDKIRGILTYRFFEKKNRFRVEVYTWAYFDSLIEWLEATGEFNEEVLRLKNWKNYLNTKTKEQIFEILFKAKEIAYSFNDMGRSVLGGYTQNVDYFRAKAKNDYRYKEDYFFVQRMENEYFLNMFGAEVMNRQLKDEFDKARNKVLLLPVCMRNKPDTGCKAVFDGKEKACKICDSTCNIGKIAMEFKKEKALVYLIPHSSTFSKFLAHWANQKDTALVGVACVLNLLTGGYEMKRLNIASQCVFLDYCSCKNHWHKLGTPTSLNLNRMKQLFVRENTFQEVN